MCALSIDVGILREIKPTGCVCPGDILTYECTVTGRPFEYTIWTGSAINCLWGYEIFLPHYHFNESERTIRHCNGAIVARSLYVIDNLYTSQLSVTLTPDIMGQTIKCATDNGAHFIIHHSTVIPTTTGLSLCKHIITVMVKSSNQQLIIL